MKKKHLRGKLSLNVKDISALEGNAQSQIKGGTIGYLPCQPVTEYTLQLQGQPPCLIPSYDVVVGCTIQGSVPYCMACNGTYMYQTCPDVQTCGYTCDGRDPACAVAASDGGRSVCVCLVSDLPPC